jgi:REP element-mobilizing transposase RayT
MPQSLTKLHIHLVFSTKQREPLLLRPFRERVHAYLASVLNNSDSQAQRVGGTSDHVHILFRMSKNLALAKVVEEVKTSSSRWIKTQEPALRAFHWQGGYGGFSVSPADVEAVTEYIDRQEEHHRVVGFQEEFRRFLETYRVEYDERYVWD